MDGLDETWSECGEKVKGAQALSLGFSNGERLGRRGEIKGIAGVITEEEGKLWCSEAR